MATEDTSPYRQGELGSTDTSGNGNRADAADRVCYLIRKYLRSRAQDLEAWDDMKDAVRVWSAHEAAGSPLHPPCPHCGAVQH